MNAVAVSFQRLILRIQPHARAVAAARGQIASVRASVVRHLRAPIRRFINLGSYQKGTEIRGRSDVDLLFVISPEHVSWGGGHITSTALLERFRRAISATYPTTSIGRDGQSVTVRFAQTGVDLDIVPAVEAGKVKNVNLYSIPDGSGGWMNVAPLAELRRFKLADGGSGGKLRRAVQLLKWWKHSRADEVRIRSYYVELVLTVAGIANGPKPYSHILLDSLGVLADRGAAGMRDPDGRVGVTAAVPARASADRVVESLRRARDYAAEAVWYEEQGSMERAVTRWRVFFNGKFPA